jgi:gliding motility-associated transport system permease protein
VTRFLALAKRELLAYFYAPVPYFVMFVFLLVVWAVTQYNLQNARAARIDFAPVFELLTFILLFLVPLLTMNSVAEERSRNTLETLLTAPVTDFQVIASKWLGTFVFFTVMIVPTLVYWVVFQVLGKDKAALDSGPVITSYAGALLLGGLYIAIGVFFSSLTENGLLSAFLAFCTMIVMMIVQPLTREAPEWIRGLADFVSQQEHFQPFLEGRIALFDVVYFLLMTSLFLFLAVRALESRKWR